MKLRRLFAALLVLVLVLTSSPVVYANTTGEGTGQTNTGDENPIAPLAELEYTSYSAADKNYVLPSAAVWEKGSGYLEFNNRDAVKADKPYIDTLLSTADGEFNKEGEEWGWFAYYIHPTAAGTYTLGLQMQGCRNAPYYVPLCINGEVYTLSYGATGRQTATVDVTLPAGDYTVVMFMPMPRTESEAKGAGNEYIDYPWANPEKILVDSALTIACPTEEAVEAVFAPKVEPVDTVISAVDTDTVLLSATIKKNAAALGRNDQSTLKADAPTIETLYSDAIGQFNASGSEWNWFAYKVSVPAAGTYTLGVKTAGCKYDSYKIPLCINGEVYALSYTAKSQLATTEVTLPAGNYVVTMFMPMPANKAAITGNEWNDYHWCDVESVTVDGELTVSKPTVAEVEACFAPPVKEDTVISAVDTNKILLSATIVKNAAALGRNDQSALKADAPTIETLYSDAAGQFNASGSEWNWFAYKVSVPAAGTYTLGVKTAGCKYDSYKIPLCINGEVYALSYTAKSQLATTEVTLPAGNYVVTMFMPMPANKAAITGNEWNDYHWCDVESVTVDGELTVSKPTVAEVEACFPKPDQVLSATDGSFMLWSAGVKATSNTLERVSNDYREYIIADAPYIDSLYADAFNQFNKSGEEWTWFAYKVNAPAAGSYTLGVSVTNAGQESYKIPLCVNGKVYSLDYSAKDQDQTATVNLAAGENVVVMFMPMPQNAAGATGTGWKDYTWVCVDSVTVSGELTVSKPTVAEVEACFPKVDTVLGAADSRLLLSETVSVKNEGGVNVISCAKQDYVRADVAYIDSLVSDAWGEFNKSGEEWNWFAYKVNAPMDGTFALSLKVQNCKFASYKIPMVVDGEVHTLTFTAKNQTVTENVSLTAGDHTVLIFMPMPQNAAEATLGVWNDHPWCNVESMTVDGYLKVSKPTEAEVDALFPYTEMAPGNQKLILINKFKDNGDTLSDADLNDMRADMPSIESLPSSGNLISRWPFISMKVNAPSDGNYTIKLKLDVKPATASKQLGVLLDGKASSAPIKFYSNFADSSVEFASFTAYLTAGDHDITFFAPMPKNLASNSKNIWNDYVWINFSSIRMTPGLTVSEKITLEEITEALDNRIEAENAEYVVYNLTNSNNAPQANGKASGGYLIGDTWNSNINQTFDEVATWINSNKQAYIEYAVIAPASGEYDIAVGFQAGASDKSVAKPYIAVIVNNTAYKAQFTKDWDQVDTVKLTVKLQEGLNIIRCTSVTVDQAIYKKGWVNFDFMDLDNRLTPVKHSSDFMEAENAKYFNKFKVQSGDKEEGATGKGNTGKVLGSSDRKYISGQNLTLDTFLYGQLKQVPYFSVTVNAPMDGYYPISLKMSIDGRQKNSSIGMVVDDLVHTVKYDKVGKQAKDGEVDTLVYLTAGEHVLTFTAPMPANAGVNANYSYYWCNYDSITLYNGLTFAKRQKEPIWDPDYTRIEVEDYALFNLNGDNGTAAGNAVYNTSQSVAEIMKDGIDGSRTPYVELKVNAKEAGPYAIFVGTTYGITEGGLWNVVDGKFVVDVNGKLETKTVRIHKTAASTVSLVWIILEEGENTVRLTHLTSDAQHGGTTWIDFDYIEMPYWVTKSIEFVKPGARLEAEDASYDGFAEEAGKEFSGGACLGRVNYDTVEDLDITYDVLDPADLGGLPHVAYRVFTEKAGTYSLSVGFKAGLSNYPTEEKAQGVSASFTVVVNGETKQRVEFTLKGDKNMARIINVDLKEGENEIIVTGTTSEYVIDRKPRNDETYRLVWINQDYLALPTGVTSMSTDEENLNIADSDIDFGQLSAKEKSEQDAADVPVVEPAEAESGFGWIWIVAGIGAAFLLFLVLLIGKKRKKEEEKV